MDSSIFQTDKNASSSQCSQAQINQAQNERPSHTFAEKSKETSLLKSKRKESEEINNHFSLGIVEIQKGEKEKSVSIELETQSVDKLNASQNKIKSKFRKKSKLKKRKDEKSLSNSFVKKSRNKIKKVKGSSIFLKI